MSSKTHRAALPAYVQNHTPYRSLYFALLNDDRSGRTDDAWVFLQQQLDLAKSRPCDLPHDSDRLAAWARRNVVETGLAYAEYRESRKQGAPRRYFANKSHALFFLNAVAPAKLVDGSWLCGTLSRWNDPRFAGLIRTYMEELGDGAAEKNHVALFRKLLAANHCEAWDQLDDRYFLQGAIQLALGRHSERLLPEVIGFNLGYEQLPLHLLITAYELEELGIDPYYFTLHITIDNLDSGHAKKSIESVFALQPAGIDRAEFYRRVGAGYRLNALGESTCAIIESFDLQAEVVKLFERKAVIGQFMHSDRCKIAGRTINDWLAASGAGELLQCLEATGWIRRHQNPCNSKFWRLIQGDRPLMFGVFSPHEQQLIFDWIAGDYRPDLRAGAVPADADNLTRAAATSVCADGAIASLAAHRGRIKAGQFKSMPASAEPRELRDFNATLAALTEPQAVMQHLMKWMTPGRHWTPTGLHATRIFKNLYGPLNALSD